MQGFFVWFTFDVDENRPQKIACDFCAYEAHSLVPNRRIKTPPAPKFGSESAMAEKALAMASAFSIKSAGGGINPPAVDEVASR